MFRSLSFKFLIGYLIFGIASFALVSTITSRMTYNRVLETEARQLREEAERITASINTSLEPGSPAMSGVLERLNSLSGFSQDTIWFIDPSGIILFDTSLNMGGETVDAFDPADTERTWRTGDFYGTLQTPMLSVSSPVIRNYRTMYYVVIHRPLSKISGLADSLLLPMYLSFAAIFLLSFVILFLIRQYVSLPLRKITKGADQFALGNLDYKIEVNSRDELGHLADTLNYMAQELASAEEYQKKFIANVSHDFRSPLTSIKGYLEAIADGTIPPELQEKYIHVIIGETERLTALTQSVLSMNLLESGKMALEKTNFDLCEVVRSTCETFAVIGEQRRLTFDLTFPEEHLMVYADRERIRQVVYNLVDNAVKFSPNDSTIEISLSRSGDSIFTTIKDSGIGIPKEDIKKIWARFYKTDESRGLDKRGTGLGLSIVKDILDAHQTTIDVISTEGVGTEFTFRLPAARTQ